MRRRAPIVLELDLTEGILERSPADPIGKIGARRRAVLPHVLEALRLAADDAHVRGLLVRLGGRRMGLGTAQELRDAVERFRAAGKWAIAWSDAFNEFGPGNVPYYVSTACDEVWLLPSGSVGLIGVGADVTFLHDALAKAGVRVEVGKRYEYKNAPNALTHAAFTPEHREATTRLVESAQEQLVAGIAAARRLDPRDVQAAIDAGPLLAEEARERGLVDRLGYRDEVHARARERAGGPGGADAVRLLFAERYRRQAARPGPIDRVRRRGEPVVALVHAVGPIRIGRSGRSPLTGDSIGSDTVSAALRAATEDDAVRAIVLRVDSPGGSAVASDVIWRSVRLARQAGKPVVVSMGDVAGSGGYYVSCGADEIVAHPGTLTGSIGVFGGKPVIRELLDRLGVTVETVTAAERALMFSTRRPFAEGEWERIQRYLDAVYDDFVAKVGEGRRMSSSAVHEVAQGRVWSGADALERGLVDRLGGLDLAIDAARDRARLATGRGTVREFPKISPLARVRPAASSEDPAAASAGLPAWEPLAGLAAHLGLPAGGALSMPFLPILE